MTKDFKIARKPGQEEVTTANISSSTTATPEPTHRKRKLPEPLQQPPVERAAAAQTTRKTIEVPEEFFYRVKMRALERRILEKELWAEILEEYFSNHPTL